MKLLKSWKNKTEKKKYLENLIGESSETPRDYDISKGHEIGEYIIHSMFGLGFVVNTIGQNKMLVFFEQFEKVLLQNWTKS